jgi:hypothetical protein
VAICDERRAVRGAGRKRMNSIDFQLELTKNCYNRIEQVYDKQSNQLRVEIMPVAPRCRARPHTDQWGREYNVTRYILSGGNAINCCKLCASRLSDKCPLHRPSVSESQTKSSHS